MEDSTVRVYGETRKKLAELHKLVLSHGWSAIGAEREDGPSLSAVVDEAVGQLLDRAAETVKKR